MSSDIVFFQNVILPLLGIATGLVSIGLGYRLLARWQQHRHELKLAERGETDGPVVRDLAGRVEMLEAQALRVQELEERLDFAERLLAQGRVSGSEDR